MKIIEQQIQMIIYGTIMKALGVTMPGASATPAVPGLGAVKNFGGTYADGGRPPVGEVSIVGERQPELFVPRTSGTIYNQEQMQSAMSTYSEANTGGTVATAPIDVSYNVTEINAMRFVTEEQMVESSRQSAMQGAKLGEQRALNRLRQSRSTRNKLGM